MTELENYIHHSFSISIDDCKSIADLFVEEEYLKHEYFLKTNKYCDKLSFIQAGAFRIFAQTPKGEVTQWISTKSYFITDLSSFLFRNLSRWNIQALTYTKVFTISYSDYQKIGKLVPKWNDLEKLFISKCFVMLENRVFNQISLSAEERYLLLYQQNPDLFNLVPQQYLASMLGMTPETFSRIRKKTIS